MKYAVIGLGSNMGNKLDNLTTATESLDLLIDTKVLKTSKTYLTKPIGFTKQDDFYNGIVLIKTNLSPFTLLGACLGIESAMGRLRNIKNGPRIIDLDLLVYDDFSCNSLELTVPHPQIKNRAFVLAPLLELFPSGNVLGNDFFINKQALENLIYKQGVKKLDKVFYNIINN